MVSSTKNVRSAMSYQNRCPECDGRGYHEYPRAVARSEGKDYYIVEIECEECSGSGEKTVGDFYESMDEAKEDYPNAISMITIR